jgi:carbamoyltransferase
MGGLFLSAARIYASQEAGGVMGMASYGKRKIKKADCFFVKDNVWSVNQEFIAELIDKENNNVFNYSKIIQEESTKIILSKIDMILEKDKDANICLSGGVFQNCHINSEVLKKHKKVFVDPIAHDGGTSMGAALLIASQHNEKIEPYKNLYLGHKEKHVFDDDFKDKHKTSPEEVAKLIHENNLVGIFQGKAEGGPRALGNRSLLFNPHNLHGKELVNIFKKRKWYRPYAGTVLHEYCHEWFNLYGKDETPFMSYAVEVIENKRRIIPAITHVDGTCRVQTLKKNQNENFYNLINSFFKLTNIPVVLNTSLNLAGKPLVNTLNDATALLNHGLDYLYLPETNILLKSKF